MKPRVKAPSYVDLNMIICGQLGNIVFDNENGIVYIYSYETYQKMSVNGFFRKFENE